MLKASDMSRVENLTHRTIPLPRRANSAERGRDIACFTPGWARCTAQTAIRRSEHIMTRILNHTGHIRAADGSVLRLDVEMGTYVARYYRPDLSVRATVCGSLAEVQTAMKGWRFVA
jgi:hypothetical protein